MDEELIDRIMCVTQPAFYIDAPTGIVSGSEYYELCRAPRRFIIYRNHILDCASIDIINRTTVCSNVLSNGTVIYGMFKPLEESHIINYDTATVKVAYSTTILPTGSKLETGTFYEVAVDYANGSNDEPSITINGRTYTTADEGTTITIEDEDINVSAVSGSTALHINVVYFEGAKYEIRSQSIPQLALDGDVLNVIT